MEELREVEAEEGVQIGIGMTGQVFTRQARHVFVIVALAARVQLAAPLVAAQIAVEFRADVIKLVEERDEFIVEILVLKARQAEGHHVEEFMIAEEISLHLEFRVAPAALELPVGKPERRDPRLQPVGAPVACL